MDLFSLVAKLTLDSKDYDKDIARVEDAGRNINITDPQLGLDTTEYDAGIAHAESEDVSDMTGENAPDLGLDTSAFDTGIATASAEDVPDMTGENAPDLDLDHSAFDAGIATASAEDVPDMTGENATKLGLNTEEYKSNLADAEAQGGLFKESLGGIFNELSGILAATGIVAAVSGIVGSLKEGVELAKTTGDAIHKQSAFMGLSIKTYQELDYAMQLSGASITDLTRSMRTFQQIAGGTETEDQTDAFKKLGINVQEVTAGLEEGQKAEALMLATMDALADYKGSDRDVLAKTLFGNNYTKLTRLLEGGSEGIKQMREEAEGLGFVMTEEEVQNAANYMDATTRLDLAVQGLKTSLVTELLPVLTDITNRIAYIVAFFSGRTGETSFADGLKETNKELALEMANVEGTGVAAMEMVDKLYKMGDATKLNAEQQAEWKETATWLIEKIPSLSGVIHLDTMEIEENRNMIRSTIEEWKALAKQRALQAAKDKKYQEFLEKNQDALDKQATARAANNLVTQKENAAIVIANKLLSENAELRERVGLTEIDTTKDVDAQLRGVEANLQEINWDQYELMHEAYSDYSDAVIDAADAQREYEKVEKELEEAQEKYDAWVIAIDAMIEEQGESAKAARSEIDGITKALNKIPRNVRTVLEIERHEIQPRSFAIGSSYIPYDMPAYLHRGEEVRTATEVRRGDNSGQISTDFEDRVIAAIREGMADANVTAVVTDRQVAKGSNRWNGNELDSRRFVP